MNAERDQKIIQEYLEGATLTDVGKRYSLSNARVQQILARYKIQSRKPGPVAIRTPKTFGKLTTRERLLKKVRIVPDEAKGEHWIWTRKSKYGSFVIDGKTYYAHRAAWYIIKRKRPIGRLRKVCLIDNCINPEHWVENTRKLVVDKETGKS